MFVTIIVVLVVDVSHFKGVGYFLKTLCCCGCEAFDGVHCARLCVSMRVQTSVRPWHL